jgi:hypothetical protein
MQYYVYEQRRTRVRNGGRSRRFDHGDSDDASPEESVEPAFGSVPRTRLLWRGRGPTVPSADSDRGFLPQCVPVKLYLSYNVTAPRATRDGGHDAARDRDGRRWRTAHTDRSGSGEADPPAWPPDEVSGRVGLCWPLVMWMAGPFFALLAARHAGAYARYRSRVARHLDGHRVLGRRPPAAPDCPN